MSTANADAGARSNDSRLFALKAARSVTSIQSRINNVADIVVLLEVLGYTHDDVVKHGFKDLHELARYTYEFIDIFDSRSDEASSDKPTTIPVPATRVRIAEGFALAFGWLGSLILLFVTGFSLWLALDFPSKFTTMFMAGIFAGILITEGPTHSYNRLFSFYYNQGNLCEVKRVMKRTYILISLILLASIGVSYEVTVAAKIPFDLFIVGTVSLTTVCIHRSTYAIVYALRRVKTLIFSFLFAFAFLLSVYYLTNAVFPVATTRYFVALGTALVVLTCAAMYEHYTVLSGNSFRPAGNIPSFFRPITINATTIRSKIGVQMWETLPNYIFGSSLFLLVFGDRILSWVFNPIRRANGIPLPFVFNSAYHAGADPALLVLFPVLLVQYTMMSPIFAQLTNATFEYKVSGYQNIRRFVSRRYARLVLASLLASFVGGVFMVILAPIVLPPSSATPLTMNILLVAVIANIFLSLFFASSLFMILTNRVTWLALFTMIGALEVGLAGAYMAQSGFENIIYAYLLAAITVALLSTFYVLVNLDETANRFFARYA